MGTDILWGKEEGRKGKERREEEKRRKRWGNVK
jgi:hypothetical protein